MQSTPVHELRLDSRNNIFVMAALYASGRSVSPVRVRNMSRSGALVEAPALPAPGTAVRLARASLSASGTMVWAEGGKGGVRFGAPVSVSDWLPQGKRGVGQQFVDELFHQKRLGFNMPGGGPMAAEATLADELRQLRLVLEGAGEELAVDGLIAARHIVALQAIDGVAQTLARIAADAASDDAGPAAKASA